MACVKICGITNIDDAVAAAAAGADMLGFIFYPPSPRNIAPESASEIIDALRRNAKAPKFVGVFVNEPVRHVRQIMEQTGIDLIQLHGSETAAMVEELRPRAYKTLQPADAGDAKLLIAKYRSSINGNAPAFIVDGKPQILPGGNGTRADWSIAMKIAREFPILVAGGLDAENVAEAIRAVKPWGVDVSSGVERAPGVKDQAKVREFIKNAKG
jgi:phosphoribosylanthranilate isomerase